MERQHNDEARGGNRGLQESRNGNSRRLVSGRQDSTTRRNHQIVRSADGRVVGDVRGGVLRKSITPTQYLRTPRAIAWDVCALDQAARLGATVAEVTDRATGTRYTADLATIREQGFKLDRGCGLQIALPLPRWHVQRAGEPPQLPLF